MMHRHSRRGSALLKTLLLFGAIAACLAFATVYQHNRFENRKFRSGVYYQRVTLPSAQTLRFLTLGYDNIYADWLWLQSIQQFGSGWLTEDKTQKPIFQYFDTLTDVDPHFISAYRFANLIIGDQRGDYVLGQEILRKGVYKNPLNYDLPYLGVYNAVWNAGKPDDARWFARRLQRIPAAPSFMKRMMEYVERKSGRFDAAFEFNVRYLVEYMAKGNTYERDIALRRTEDLLERLYHSHFKEAIKRYKAKNGKYPARLEDLFTQEYMPPYQAPTMQSFSAAIEYYHDDIVAIDKEKEVPEKLVSEIVAASRQNIVGLPPEPLGTWFYLNTPMMELYTKRADLNIDKEDKVPFIVTARSMLQNQNFTALEFQNWLMTFYKENNRQPTDKEAARWLGRDLLGGHWIYQRKHPESPIYGVYYSTAGMRYEKKKEPRLGAQGPGPFPFQLEPRLADYAEDLKWGIENGYVGLDGSEFWEKAKDAPADTEPTAAKVLPGT